MYVLTIITAAPMIPTIARVSPPNSTAITTAQIGSVANSKDDLDAEVLLIAQSCATNANTEQNRARNKVPAHWAGPKVAIASKAPGMSKIKKTTVAVRHCIKIMLKLLALRSLVRTP